MDGKDAGVQVTVEHYAPIDWRIEVTWRTLNASQAGQN
jgi:hypothetical protein